MPTTITHETSNFLKQGTPQGGVLKEEMLSAFGQFGKFLQSPSNLSVKSQEENSEIESGALSDLLDSDASVEEDLEPDLPVGVQGMSEVGKEDQVKQEVIPVHFLVNGWRNSTPKTAEGLAHGGTPQKPVAGNELANPTKSVSDGELLGARTSDVSSVGKATLKIASPTDSTITATEKTPVLDLNRPGFDKTLYAALNNFRESAEQTSAILDDAKAVINSGINTPALSNLGGVLEGGSLRSRPQSQESPSPAMTLIASKPDTNESPRRTTVEPTPTFLLPKVATEEGPLAEIPLLVNQVTASELLSTTSAYFTHATPVAVPDGRQITPQATAAAVAQQMAIAISQNPDGTTELVLSPEELGRVSLTMKTQDGVATLVIQAERPETQDLMRRHIDALSQELRAMGFQDVKYSFSDAKREQSQQRSSDSNPSVSKAEADEFTQSTTNRSGHQDGLDLRL